jgi:alcohol dehydrogenase
MRAVLLHAHGGLDQLVYEPHWADPIPGPGDAILRVRACALNHHDVFTRKGMPGIRLRLPVIVGNDAAGEVVSTAADVPGLQPGARVLVDPSNRVEGGFMGETFDGGLAEYLRVPAHMLVPLDPAIGFAEAAALPVAYGTAHRMLVTRGRIQPGETVVVLGASGGVGTCCVQLARRLGATVIACASSDAKLAKLAALGAEIGINTNTTDWVAECQRRFGKARVHGRASGGVDVVVNFTGGETWRQGLRCLKRQGRMLTCGATAGFDPPEDIRYIWTFELTVAGSNGWSREDILALLGMVRAGTLEPVLHPRRFALEEAREAMRLLDERQAVGKVIVEP